MKQKLTLVVLLTLSASSLFFVFLFIEPNNKPLIIIFIPVILAWILLYSFIKLLLILFLRKTNRLHTIGVAVTVSFVILLFLLSGIGQLSVADIVLILLLAAVTGFYFYRTWV